ncbi:glycosyltransferase family 4 protein [Thermolongibacillus altinsuensis]
MRKVMIIVPSMKKVAPITVVFNICKYIDKSSIQLFIYSLDKSTDNNTYYEEFKKYCKVITSTGRIYKDIFNILQICKKNNIDILHANGFRPNIIVNLVKKIAAVLKKNILTVSTIHSIENEDFILSRGKLKGTIGYKTNLYLYKNIDKIVAISNATKNYLLNTIKHKNIEVVYNGIDIELFSKKNKKNSEGVNFNIGAAAKLIPIKRINHLIEAINILVNENKVQNIKVHIAGDGPMIKDLVKMAEDYNVKKYIEFYGHVDNMAYFYNNIDCLVIPSMSEGFPLVSIEAQAMGIPVVASNVKGLNETIEDSKTGFLFEYGNISELVNKLLLLINNPTLKKEMGERAARRVKNRFSAQLMANKYMEVYKRLHEESYSK